MSDNNSKSWRGQLVQTFGLDPTGISWLGEYTKAEFNSKKGTWKVGKDVRVLVIYKWWIYAWKEGANKWSHNFHLLDLQSVISPDQTKLALVMKGKGSLELGALNTDAIIEAIDDAYNTYFSCIPDDERVQWDVDEERMPLSIPPPPKPCGGFDQTYAAVCDYLNIDCYPRIQDDVFRLHANNVTEFTLNEFQGASTVALLHTLRMNQYFRSVSFVDVKAKGEIMDAVSKALYGCRSLDTITLQAVDGDKAGWATLTSGLVTYAEHLMVTKLSIVNCGMDNSSLSTLATFINNMPHGLHTLNLQGNDCKKSGAIALLQAIHNNPHHTMALQELTLAGVPLDNNASGHLGQFMASGNSVSKLALIACAPKWEILSEATKMGGCSQLAELDISQNKITSKEVGYVADALQSLPSLTALTMDNMNMNSEQYVTLLSALVANEEVSNVRLQARNNGLTSMGALKTAEIIAETTLLRSIDLSDNIIGDEGIHELAAALTNHASVHEVYLNGCWKEASKKNNKGRALLSLMRMCASSAPIEVLHLAGGADKKNQWGTQLCQLLINEIAVNNTLRELNVMNNGLGDTGGAAIGQMLQTNRTLTSLQWDGNGCSYQGFNNFLYGLQRNQTLSHMPLPLEDASKVMSEQVIDALNQMSQLIVKNNQRSFGGLRREVANVRHLHNAELRERLLFGMRITDESSIGSSLFQDALKEDDVIDTLQEWKEYEHGFMTGMVRDKMAPVIDDIFKVMNSSSEALVSTIVGVLTDKEKGFSSDGLMDAEVQQELTEVLNDAHQGLDKDELTLLLQESLMRQVQLFTGELLDNIGGIAVSYVDDVVEGKLKDKLNQLQEAQASSSSSSSSSDDGSSDGKKGKDKRRYSSRGVAKVQLGGGGNSSSGSKGKGKGKALEEESSLVEEVQVESKPLEIVKKPVRRPSKGLKGRRPQARQPGSPGLSAAAAIAKPLEESLSDTSSFGTDDSSPMLGGSSSSSGGGKKFDPKKVGGMGMAMPF